MNDNDFINFLFFLQVKNAKFYDKNKEEIEQIPVVEDGIEAFFIGYNQNDCIVYQPSYYSMKCLQMAILRIEDSKDSRLRKLFSEIKKYIRSTCLLSSDKMFYIGMEIYQDWIDKKYCFPVLFKYSEFVIDEAKIEAIFEELEKDEYRVKNNKVRLRNVDVLDLSGESFVIFLQTASIVTKVIRKSVLVYDYGSECIFVYRRNRKYIFQLDQRLMEGETSKTFELFEEIRQKWS